MYLVSSVHHPTSNSARSNIFHDHAKQLTPAQVANLQNQTFDRPDGSTRWTSSLCLRRTKSTWATLRCKPPLWTPAGSRQLARPWPRWLDVPEPTMKHNRPSPRPGRATPSSSPRGPTGGPSRRRRRRRRRRQMPSHSLRPTQPARTKKWPSKTNERPCQCDRRVDIF